jgi:hypothetical protein
MFNFIQYNKWNIIALKKHVYVNHFVTAKVFEKEMNNIPLRANVERPLAKKIFNLFRNSIFIFFVIDHHFKFQEK